MLRFLTRLGVFAAVQLGIAAFLLGMRPADSSSDGYLAASFDKLHRLEATPGERLILVGGSGVAFGFNSHLLEQGMKRPVVNLGLHAAIPLEWSLNELAPRLHPQDVVVVIPEYLLAGLDPSGTLGDKVTRLTILRPGSVWNYPARIWREMNWTATHTNGPLRLTCLTLQQAVKDHVADLRGLEIRPSHSGPDYSRTAFNEYGDHAAHWSKSESPTHSFEMDPFPVQPIFQHALAINEFADRARARGATVLFCFPSMARESVLSQERLFEEADRGMRDRLRVPIIGAGHVEPLAPSDMYDTPYHLSGQGADARTKRLCDAIQLHFAQEAQGLSTETP